MERRNVKNIRMIKKLLENPDGSLTMYALAKASGASQPWGVKFIKRLEKKDLVSGTKVKEVIELARYGSNISPAPLRVVHLYHPDPIKFIKKNLKVYAVTTYFAENIITHLLFPSRCDVYVKIEVLEDIHGKIMSEGMMGSGNLRLLVPVDPEVVNDIQVIGGTKVVGIGQLMIDLIQEGGVCVQAVEEMVSRNVWKG